MSQIAVLNVGTGDTKLSFDSDDPNDVKRVGEIVRDMIRRGYAVLVEVGEHNGKPTYQRAEDFDPETSEYIITGNATPPIFEVKDDRNDEPKATARGRKTEKKKPRTSNKRPVNAKKTKAVGVARTAGG